MARAQLLKNSSFQEFKKAIPNGSNGVIISSHMMENYKGVLPGQKVFRWDRLDEYKNFTKKAKNEISEIKGELNESVLSHESYSLINQNLLDQSRGSRQYAKGPRAISGDFENFEINQRNETSRFDAEDLEILKGEMGPQIANFKKRSYPEILNSREQILERESPKNNRKIEPFKSHKMAQESDRWAKKWANPRLAKKCRNSLFYSGFKRRKSESEDTRKAGVLSLVMSLVSRGNANRLNSKVRNAIYVVGVPSTVFVLVKLLRSPKYRQQIKKMLIKLWNTGVISSSVMFILFLLFVSKSASDRRSSGS